MSSITVNGVTITTTVIPNAAMVDSHINNIMSAISRNSKALVGLDVEWKPNNTAASTNKLAILQLCVGERCWIFQLCYFDYIPQSLKNLLGDLSTTFVGVGIEKDVRKLNRDYGVECKIAFELGPLAASVLGRSDLRGYSLVDLARQWDSVIGA